MTFMRIIHTELFMNNSVIDEFKFPRGKKVLSENMRRPKNIFMYIQYYTVLYRYKTTYIHYTTKCKHYTKVS